jgi:hypothetical protein
LKKEVASPKGEVGGFISELKLYSEENHPTSPLGEATLFLLIKYFFIFE